MWHFWGFFWPPSPRHPPHPPPPPPLPAGTKDGGCHIWPTPPGVGQHKAAPTRPPTRTTPLAPPKAFRATASGPRGAPAPGAGQPKRCAGDAERRGEDAGLRAASTATPFAVPGGRGKDVLPTCSLSPWCPEGKSRRLLHPSDAAQPVGCRPHPVEVPPPLTGAPQRSKLPARASPESLPSPSEQRRKG